MNYLNNQIDIRYSLWASIKLILLRIKLNDIIIIIIIIISLYLV